MRLLGLAGVGMYLNFRNAKVTDLIEYTIQALDGIWTPLNQAWELSW